MRQQDSYITQCRTNYFLNIFPGDPTSKSTDPYQALVRIAKQFFDEGRYDEFESFFMEGTYLIPLWTAHLILEFGQANDSLKEKCLKVISEYTDNPLAPIAAKQEQVWLDNYFSAR